MTPVEARKPSSEADAQMAMEMVAIRGRKFPILQVGEAENRILDDELRTIANV